MKKTGIRPSRIMRAQAKGDRNAVENLRDLRAKMNLAVPVVPMEIENEDAQQAEIVNQDGIEDRDIEEQEVDVQHAPIKKRKTVLNDRFIFTPPLLQPRPAPA